MAIRNWRAAAIFAVSLAAILHLSLYPWHFISRKAWDWWFTFPIRSRSDIVDTALNVWLYAPLGAAGYLWIRRRWAGMLGVFLFGTGLSILIEQLQFYIPQRIPNVRDVVSNSAGTAIGALLGYASQHPAVAGRLRRLVQVPAWRISSDGATLLILWFLWRMFPFLPTVRIPRLLEDLQAVQHFSGSWVNAVHVLAAFFLLRLVLGPTRWVPVAFLALLAEGGLRSHTLAPPSIVGGAAGWLLGRQASSQRSIAPWAGWVTLAAFVVDELRPFRLASHTAAFTWVPFGGLFNTGDGYSISILGKLFLFTGGLWLLRRSGWRTLYATLALAVTIGLGEWTQQWIEGRTPEIADAILVVLAGGITGLMRPVPGTKIRQRSVHPAASSYGENR